MKKLRGTYLGIDIGGSKICGVRLTSGGRIAARMTVLTPKTKRRFLEALKELGSALKADRNIRGVGIGLPGMIDMRRGVVLRAPNVPYLKGWQAAAFFRELFGAAALIDNDSRCFLRAELTRGAARGRRNVAALVAGTGIGGGIAIGGALYYGAHGSAGEFGHTVIKAPRTLEELSGGKSRVSERQRIFALGIGVANCINALDPDLVVVGGGVMRARRAKLGAVQRVARRFIISPRARKTPIVLGTVGEHAPALGAALLFAELRV